MCSSSSSSSVPLQLFDWCSASSSDFFSFRSLLMALDAVLRCSISDLTQVQHLQASTRLILADVQHRKFDFSYREMCYELSWTAPISCVWKAEVQISGSLRRMWLIILFANVTGLRSAITTLRWNRWDTLSSIPIRVGGEHFPVEPLEGSSDCRVGVVCTDKLFSPCQTLPRCFCRPWTAEGGLVLLFSLSMRWAAEGGADVLSRCGTNVKEVSGTAVLLVLLHTHLVLS